VSDSDRIRGRSSTHRAIAAVLMGGALVCAGSALPWMSFFAGLQSLSGLVGLYGRILLASGALAVLAGAAMLRRNDTWLPLATAALGLLQTIFILWLLIGVRDTMRGLGMHAMLLPRPGPGLFVCLGGALLIMLVPWRVMNGGWRGASRSE
jgi:hypothetical protein